MKEAFYAATQRPAINWDRALCKSNDNIKLDITESWEIYIRFQWYIALYGSITFDTISFTWRGAVSSEIWFKIEIELFCAVTDVTHR